MTRILGVANPGCLLKQRNKYSQLAMSNGSLSTPTVFNVFFPEQRTCDVYAKDNGTA